MTTPRRSPRLAEKAARKISGKINSDPEEKLPAGMKEKAKLPPQTPTKPKAARNSGKYLAPESPNAVSPAGSDSSIDSVGGYPFETPPQRSTWDDTGLDTPITPPTTGGYNGKKSHTHLGSPLPRNTQGLKTQSSVVFKNEEYEDDEEDEEAVMSSILSKKAFLAKLEPQPREKKEEVDIGLNIEDVSTSAGTIKNEESDGVVEEEATTRDIEAENQSYELPGGPILGFIIPFDVHTRYKEDASNCVAFKVEAPYERCTQRRAKNGASLKTVFSSLLDSCEHYQRNEYDDVLKIIDQFVEKALCPGHKGTAKKRMEPMQNYLRKVSQDQITPAEFGMWIDAISTPAGPTAVPISTAKSNFSSGEAYDDPKFALKPVGRVDSSNVGINGPRSKIRISITEAVSNVAWDAMAPGSREDGYIYFLTHRTSEGCLKIGYTKDPKERKKKWDKQCGRTHTMTCLGFVKHAYRVEQLIHAELKDMHMNVKCGGCGSRHREWFKVKEEHLRKVFLKWKTWINLSPYGAQVDSDLWRLDLDNEAAKATLPEIYGVLHMKKIAKQNIKKELSA
ncbi:DUF1766-domain-containing protein [Periconia macrospinosa]|uniref:DUF1766-domain-containing protein n=1 Tax=Periconia macrospinosa TaxID=97972 RepID=A0A2V1DU81_9PLEO|nr:DUF1766-domain-containing protein [Periconia macrospinosa]